jgi:hypothetical protein
MHLPTGSQLRKDKYRIIVSVQLCTTEKKAHLHLKSDNKKKQNGGSSFKKSKQISRSTDVRCNAFPSIHPLHISVKKYLLDCGYLTLHVNLKKYYPSCILAWPKRMNSKRRKHASALSG